MDQRIHKKIFNLIFEKEALPGTDLSTSPEMTFINMHA